MYLSQRTIWNEQRAAGKAVRGNVGGSCFARVPGTCVAPDITPRPRAIFYFAGQPRHAIAWLHVIRQRSNCVGPMLSMLSA